MCEIGGLYNAVARQTVRGFGSYTSSQTEVLHLRPVESVDITIVVDNSIDFLLASNDRVRRPAFAPGWSKRPKLVAEHGYSILFTFRKKGEEKTFLFDAGLTPESVTHNLDVIGIKLSDIDLIVLSHGHIDHHGGLTGLVKKIGKRNLPLLLHPDSWRNRKVMVPSGAEWELPPPDRKELEKEDVRIVEDRAPSLIVGDEALVTGQVERITDFERGLPRQYALVDGGWVEDPWVWDDQGIICNIDGKGLLVVSSCSHSGVVNILRNAQRITGIRRIHAFIGGLHLPGSFEKIIPQTVDELDALHPEVIVPGHCTGWKATQEIARRLPDAFIPSSVGTQIHFG